MADFNGIYDFGFPFNPDCPGGNGGDEQDIPSFYKRKRPNAVKACLACRRRKVRCDGGEPLCLPCLKRNLPCQWVAHKPKPRRKRKGRTTKATASTPDQTSADQFLPWNFDTALLCPPTNPEGYRSDPTAQSDLAFPAQADFSSYAADSNSLPATDPWFSGPACSAGQNALLPSDYAGPSYLPETAPWFPGPASSDGQGAPLSSDYAGASSLPETAPWLAGPSSCDGQGAPLSSDYAGSSTFPATTVPWFAGPPSSDGQGAPLPSDYAGSSSIAPAVSWFTDPACSDRQYAPLPYNYHGFDTTRPYTSSLTQTPVFSGLPFYTNTPSARAATVPAHHVPGNSIGAGNPTESTGFDPESFLAQDSFDVDAVRRDVSQDAWLASLFQTEPCTVPGSNEYPMVIRSSPEYPTPISSSNISDTSLLQESPYSDDSSMYDVTVYGGARVVVEAAQPSPTGPIPDWAQFVLDDSCFSGAWYGFERAK